MNKTDRRVSIVQALEAERWQRAEDLAAAFDVSLRTIYRDMRALDAAGVPLKAVPGKGYRLPKGYFLAPVLLTAEEAAALLLATGPAPPRAADAAAARAARLKVEAVLPGPARERVRQQRERLRWGPVNVFDQPGEQQRLERLREALVTSRGVRFRAHDAVRTVHPYGLVHRAGAWYLVGYDRERERVDTFRVRDLVDLAVLDEAFERPPGYRLHPEDEGGEPQERRIRVLFDAVAAPWVEAAPTFLFDEPELQPDGRLLVTLRVRREAEVIPWLLGWGAHARVVDPPSLRQRLAEEADRMATQYRADLALLS